MLKNINLPNKITLLRMILVPIFIVFMALPSDFVWPSFVALGIYLVAAITDFVDGVIARKHGLVTKFGKIMDPLADKLIVSAGFIMLAGLGVLPAWVVCIIILRDFLVNSFRMFGSDNGKDLAASLSGKLKTVFQLSFVVLALVGIAYSHFSIEPMTKFLEFINASNMDLVSTLINVFMSVALIGTIVTTLWSLVDYFIKFKSDMNVHE